MGTLPRTSSTSGSACTPSTCSASTKCCRAQAPIVSRLGCVARSGSRRAPSRAWIGQPLMSVRTHDKHKDSVIEALRRTKFKFPGRQKIYISKKWGFTKWDREVYEEMRANGKLQPDGVNV